MSVRRSCGLALLRPSVWYAKSEAGNQSVLRQRIRDIAMSRPRFGHLRVLLMLKREGWQVGKKRVYRLYRLEGPAAAHKGQATQAHCAAARQGRAGHWSDLAEMVDERREGAGGRGALSPSHW